MPQPTRMPATRSVTLLRRPLRLLISNTATTVEAELIALEIIPDCFCTKFEKPSG
jgi:hypothetical protein